LQIDSRFHSGSYRVESSLSTLTPGGFFVILGDKLLTLIPLLPIILVITVALIVAVVVLERRDLSHLLLRGKAKRRRPRRSFSMRHNGSTSRT
jgi:hypothetical protein